LEGLGHAFQGRPFPASGPFAPAGSRRRAGKAACISSDEVNGVIDSSNHLISVFEVKGEIDSEFEVVEPYAQAIVNYAHSHWKKSEEYPTFNFPCLIITVFGLTSVSSLVY
jgi:hypothetical protein